MTDREKKLLIFLLGTLFIIVNLIALNKFYLPRLNSAKGGKKTAESDLRIAEMTLTSAAIYEPQIDWVERSGTVASDRYRAESDLAQFVRKQARARRLDIKDEDPLEYSEGQFFGRVKVQFKVTGMERDVVSWLTSIHRVEQRQVVTKLEIKPNSDPTKVDVEVEIEKWIIPTDEV